MLKSAESIQIAKMINNVAAPAVKSSSQVKSISQQNDIEDTEAVTARSLDNSNAQDSNSHLAVQSKTNHSTAQYTGKGQYVDVFV